MNARTPYWPLLRNELGMDHCPKILWALNFGVCLLGWLLASSVPLLLLVKSSGGNLWTFFAAFGDLAGFGLICWLAVAGALFAFAFLPEISNPSQNVRAFEFMFTRAIDRRRLFRTRVAVTYLLMLGPLLLNLLVSARMSETTWGSDVSDASTLTSRGAQYTEAFPNSYSKAAETPGQPASIVIPRGALVLTAWVLALGTLSLLLMQSYCLWLARRVHHNPWRAGLALAAPALFAFYLAPRIPDHCPHFYEESFLFFARNLVPVLAGLIALLAVVQIVSERRFRKLEIL